LTILTSIYEKLQPFLIIFFKDTGLDGSSFLNDDFFDTPKSTSYKALFPVRPDGPVTPEIDGGHEYDEPDTAMSFLRDKPREPPTLSK